jgi:hypothetical protein
MRPEVDQILGLSAGQLLAGIAPLLPASYEQGTASLIAFMMMLSAQEYDRAADIRAVENTELRALLDELAPLIADAQLKSALLEAAPTKDVSLTVSVLNAANHELRRLLIALQTQVEQMPGAKARAAERRIWDVLRASAARRLVRLPVG